MSFQLPTIRMLCPDACQRLILHPLLVNAFSVTSFRTFLTTPSLPYICGRYQRAGRN